MTPSPGPAPKLDKEMLTVSSWSISLVFEPAYSQHDADDDQHPECVPAVADQDRALAFYTDVLG